MQSYNPQGNWAPGPPQNPAQGTPPPVHRGFRIAGRWYYVVLIATAGTFAWVPFVHAAHRLRTKKSRLLALIYGALDVVIYVLLSLTPQNTAGQPQATSNSLISTIGGLLAIAVIIVGCIQLGPLRRMVYEGALISNAPAVDPAVQAILAARSRREESRKLAREDPMLARELHVGRPDLARTYDDGGLVDLNTAPAHTIADVCGIPPEVGAAIVEARGRHGGSFANVDELLVIADLPTTTWDSIRDRAVLLS
ncbi:MAG TPA: helix-hairpin-helix domain-containing protein [Pseudonocardiaceae bacterium]|jgi:DNA uptake protein ComE-like DNA-binding protein|nr:helix-hairpin-helix domain-containing protein [Pseudonocardiaceae bacterium]